MFMLRSLNQRERSVLEVILEIFHFIKDVRAVVFAQFIFGR